MAITYELKLDRLGNLEKFDSDLRKFWNKKITWSIGDDRIRSFKIIPRDGDNPFTEPLSTVFVKKQVAKVKFDTDITHWYYSITWIDERSGTEHPVDPKIAIKPFIGTLESAIVITALAVTTTVLFFKVLHLKRKLKDIKNQKRY